MKILIDETDQVKNFRLDNITVKDLLAKLKINPVTVIVAVNNEMVTLDDVVKKNDSVRIMSVVSGG